MESCRIQKGKPQQFLNSARFEPDMRYNERVQFPTEPDMRHQDSEKFPSPIPSSHSGIFYNNLFQSMENEDYSIF